MSITLERQANSIGAIHERHLRGEKLPPGALAKVIHLLPEEEQGIARDIVASAQSPFWAKHGPFRWGLSPVRNFNRVVDLLPVREQFAAFADVKEGDLVVDLGAGSVDMARYFTGCRVAGYVAIDSSPLIEPRARMQLERLGYNPRVLIHDLARGLPRELNTIISELAPNRVNYLSNWAITYLPAADFVMVVGDCFNSEISHGVETVLSFNMLTNGKFDTGVLKTHFRQEIVPQQKRSLRGGVRLVGAALSLPSIIRFGRELPEAMPVWYPDEIVAILTDRGFEVVDIDSSLLWGQSTAMKVRKKVA